MLKENELRIGNYLYDAIGNIGSVVISGNSFVLSTEDRGYVSLQECTPIPLTPEILEKCGFEKIGSDTYGDRFFTFFNGGILSRNYDKAVMSVCVDYLHQLQNLYFALTQTELIINL